MNDKHVLSDKALNQNYVEKGYQNWMQCMHYLVHNI